MRIDSIDAQAAEPVASRAASRTGAVDAKLDLATALATLPEDYREVIVLREMQQMTYEQISQVLAIPLGTVESRLYRARAELRACLADWNERT